MLDHIRHVARSARYNGRSLMHPRRAVSLAAAFYRNEAAFARRHARLKAVLGADASALERALRESSEVMEYCRGELRRRDAVFPGLLNPNYGPVLYAAVRLLRPRAVVETGVASGVSSTFLLSALERNAEGRLYSIDLPLSNERLVPAGRETGWLVPSGLRPRWELTLADARTGLPALLERLGAIDVFYHDSDHSYEHMLWEYGQAYGRIRAGGLLLSDDIAANRAWRDFTSTLDGPTTSINRTGLHRKAEE